MQPFHFAVLDAVSWREADDPCPHCAALLPSGEPGGKANEKPPTARSHRVAAPITGERAPAVRMVMIAWFTATTVLSVVLTLTR
ncbi:hypothetical protein [Streptomyces ficellus]|uniref:Uncharacterized protein n=1 Tax=Streptomyces ficellus TaxID=1977088 RepID=A0A6I6FWC5_9ACTN|nr:hypothetical protein [Streptomyces ficellus]QGV82348.1 hypothetical protein EIZ62_31910 [Streptomyces ficellus]